MNRPVRNRPAYLPPPKADQYPAAVARGGPGDDPDLIATPWGVEWRHTDTGLYDGGPGTRPLSAGALLDDMARWVHRTRGAWDLTSPPAPHESVPYTLVADRIVFLWPTRSIGWWRPGHAAQAGPLDGQWLDGPHGLWLALDQALAYVRSRDGELPRCLDRAGVTARLHPGDRRAR